MDRIQEKDLAYWLSGRLVRDALHCIAEEKKNADKKSKATHVLTDKLLEDMSFSTEQAAILSRASELLIGKIFRMTVDKLTKYLYRLGRQVLSVGVRFVIDDLVHAFMVEDVKFTTRINEDRSSIPSIMALE